MGGGGVEFDAEGVQGLALEIKKLLLRLHAPVLHILKP